MASNSSTQLDEDRESSDWIELHNPTAEAVNLSGWAVSDARDQLDKWRFPSVQLDAGAYLVVFASGKDRSSNPDQLHTNFKLSKDGEYLGLVRPDGTVAHEFAPSYPPQRTDISYGIDEFQAGAAPGFMASPTPGAANTEVFVGFMDETRFSSSGGYFDEAFQLQMTTATDGAEIRYTTDGTPPTRTDGNVYTGPLTIENTTTLRAAAFKPGYMPGRVQTSTYLFLDDILRQTKPESYPDLRAGDYDVDPDIASSDQYRDRFLLGLREIPSLSLVLTPDDFIGEHGIYRHPTSRGDAWERAASVEMINPDGSTEQIDAGLRIQGGASRSPTTSPKHSLSLRFRSQYGKNEWSYSVFERSPVDRFETLSLRAGSNNSWTSNNAVDRRHAQMIRDQWVRDSLIDMGHIDAGRGTYVHVYLNGLYWGVYNLTERPDSAHYANYFGGDADDYDAFNGNQVIDGTPDALNEMRAVAAAQDWQRLQQILDIDRYIDYQIINRYGANGDLDATRNYRLAGGGPGQAPWRVYPWDSEEVLISSGSTGIPTDPVGIRTDVQKILEFRVRFADRLQKHFFNGGALTPEKSAERWIERADEIDLAIIGESARWGDHRQPDRPHDRDNDWLTEQNRLLKEYFPQRSRVVIDLYRREGVFPSVDAPKFNQHGGHVAAGFAVDLSASDETIYFTTDGSDPRQPGGAVAPTAQVYSQPLPLQADTIIKARAFHQGEWSALNEAEFVVVSPVALRITEINAHPHTAPPVDAVDEPDVDHDLFEFVELSNVGDQPINLSGARLVETVVDFESEGIRFIFGDQTLDPGQRTVVVRDRAAFVSRYGLDVPIAAGEDGVGGPQGEFGGDLADDGERITLLDSSGVVVQQFDYRAASNAWSRVAGIGSTLETRDPTGNYNEASNWQASFEFGGSPGEAALPQDHRVIISELSAADGLESGSWIELHNQSDEDVEIGNWYLSNSVADLFQFQIDAPLNLTAQGYHVFEQSRLGFGFDRGHGGEVWLVQSDQRGIPVRFADHVRYAASAPGSTLARSSVQPDRLTSVVASSPGAPNHAPEVGDVIISEINFHPRDLDGTDAGLKADNFEFIELYNRTDVEIDVSGWRLAGDIDLTFREGTLMSPGQTVVAVSISPRRSTQANPFRNAYGIDRSVELVGSYVGTLQDESGVIRLERPTPPTADASYFVPFVVVDEVQYSTRPPWPNATPETGETLTRARADGVGNVVDHWHGAMPSPGTSDLPLRQMGDSNEDGRFNSVDLVFAMQAGKFETGMPATFAEGDWNRDGVFNLEDLAAAAATGRFQLKE